MIRNCKLKLSVLLITSLSIITDVYSFYDIKNEWQKALPINLSKTACHSSDSLEIFILDEATSYCYRINKSTLQADSIQLQSIRNLKKIYNSQFGTEGKNNLDFYLKFIKTRGDYIPHNKMIGLNMIGDTLYSYFYGYNIQREGDSLGEPFYKMEYFGCLVSFNKDLQLLKSTPIEYNKSFLNNRDSFFYSIRACDYILTQSHNIILPVKTDMITSMSAVAATAKMIQNRLVIDTVLPLYLPEDFYTTGLGYKGLRLKTTRNYLSFTYFPYLYNTSSYKIYKIPIYMSKNDIDYETMSSLTFKPNSYICDIQESANSLQFLYVSNDSLYYSSVIMTNDTFQKAEHLLITPDFLRKKWSMPIMDINGFYCYQADTRKLLYIPYLRKQK